jgi:hypothetical protein
VDRCGCACLPPGVPCLGPLGVLAWPRWSCLGFRSSPVSRPVTMQPINNLQPPHSGVWSSDDCVCRERRLRELCSLGLLVLTNRMAGVVPAKGLSWPSVVRLLVRFRLLAFFPRVCACMRLGRGRLVACLASGSHMDVASRLAFPACWVQGSHSITASVGPLSFPSGNSLSPPSMLCCDGGRVRGLWCVTHAVHTLQSHRLVGSLWCVPDSGNWLRPLLVFRCCVVVVL